MSKLSCNVIKDLIPSYVDGICSGDSKILVEEHMKDCKECGRLLEMLKGTELAARAADAKEIEYMKRVKKHFTYKNLLCFGLLLFFVAAGTVTVISHYGNVPLELYYVVGAALMLISYFIVSDSVSKRQLTRIKLVLGSLGALLSGYGIVLMLLGIGWIKSGVFPTSIRLEQLGPFMYYQLLIIAAVQMVIFIAAFVLSLKTANSYSIVMNMVLIGGCMAFGFISILKRMASIESFSEAVSRSILIFLTEGIIMTGILWILERKRLNF